MRLLAWNIRQGGGSRLPRIADALKRHDADIVVLSEYRGGPSALRLCPASPFRWLVDGRPLPPRPCADRRIGSPTALGSRNSRSSMPMAVALAPRCVFPFSPH